MDVKHAPIAIGSEYLYQSVAPAGLLSRSLEGCQHPEPPPRFAFARLVCEGPACGFFLCVEQDLLRGLIFCGRHGVFLLSLHNAVQRTMTSNGLAVKVKCTNLCNNFSHGTKIRDEAQSRAPERDP